MRNRLAEMGQRKGNVCDALVSRFFFLCGSSCCWGRGALAAVFSLPVSGVARRRQLTNTWFVHQRQRHLAAATNKIPREKNAENSPWKRQVFAR